MEQYHKQTEIETKVRNLINKVTNAKYISSLEIFYEDGLYTLRLGLNCKDASPISLGFQGNESDFLIFLEKEFRKRKLQNVRYTSTTLINEKSDSHKPIIEL